jgi:DNA modification methylase
MIPYYQDELVTLYWGDCKKIVSQLKGKFSLLLTDPPYGLAHRNEAYYCKPTIIGETKIQVMHKGRDNSEWDSNLAPQWLIDMLIDKCYNSIIFGGNYYRLPPTRCWLVWDKKNEGRDYANCELAWTNLPMAVRMVKCLWNGMLRDGGETRYHPTQKPLKVILWAMEKRKILTKGVLDPFCGSGTTLVACKLKGIRGTGIEINKEYCDITVKRLRRIKCQSNL